MGAGGLKIEPAAACSRELILHAAPVSSTPSVIQPAEAARQTLLATSGQLHSVFCGTDARLNQDTLPPPTLRLGARRQYTMRCRWRREGMAGWWWVSVSAVENNRDAFGTPRLIRYCYILLSPFRPAVFFFQSQLPKQVSSPCAEVG